MNGSVLMVNNINCCKNIAAIKAWINCHLRAVAGQSPHWQWGMQVPLVGRFTANNWTINRGVNTEPPPPGPLAPHDNGLCSCTFSSVISWLMQKSVIIYQSLLVEQLIRLNYRKQTRQTKCAKINSVHAPGGRLISTPFSTKRMAWGSRISQVSRVIAWGICDGKSHFIKSIKLQRRWRNIFLIISVS